MTTGELDTLDRFGTALADPIRRRILLTLLAGPTYPNILLEGLDTSQPNLSNHLACLRGCGLVQAHREGKRVRYQLASPRLAHALEDLVSLELDIDDDHPDLDRRT